MLAFHGYMHFIFTCISLLDKVIGDGSTDAAEEQQRLMLCQGSQELTWAEGLQQCTNVKMTPL